MANQGGGITLKQSEQTAAAQRKIEEKCSHDYDVHLFDTQISAFNMLRIYMNSDRPQKSMNSY